MSNWLLIANSRMVYIHELQAPHKLIKTIKHGESILKDEELTNDRAGSFGNNSFRHNDPHEVNVEQFVSSIADFINDEANKNHVSSLTIAAEPKFLGVFLKHLDKKVTIKSQVSKDYISNIEKENMSIDEILELMKKS